MRNTAEIITIIPGVKMRATFERQKEDNLNLFFNNNILHTTMINKKVHKKLVLIGF
jgi:hypothetical protein